MGGVFQTYAFWDREFEMVYVIDTSIYFPAGNKLRYMIELEGIAKTIVPRRIN
jgi:hypothetical protein